MSLLLPTEGTYYHISILRLLGRGYERIGQAIQSLHAQNPVLEFIVSFEFSLKKMGLGASLLANLELWLTSGFSAS